MVKIEKDNFIIASIKNSFTVTDISLQFIAPATVFYVYAVRMEETEIVILTILPALSHKKLCKLKF